MASISETKSSYNFSKQKDGFYCANYFGNIELIGKISFFSDAEHLRKRLHDNDIAYTAIPDIREFEFDPKYVFVKRKGILFLICKIDSYVHSLILHSPEKVDLFKPICTIDKFGDTLTIYYKHGRMEKYHCETDIMRTWRSFIHIQSQKKDEKNQYQEMQDIEKDEYQKKMDEVFQYKIKWDLSPIILPGKKRYCGKTLQRNCIGDEVVQKY